MNLLGFVLWLTGNHRLIPSFPALSGTGKSGIIPRMCTCVSGITAVLVGLRLATSSNISIWASLALYFLRFYASAYRKPLNLFGFVLWLTGNL